MALIVDSLKELISRATGRQAYILRNQNVDELILRFEPNSWSPFQRAADAVDAAWERNTW